MSDKQTDQVLEELASVLTNRGKYRVIFPDGSIQFLSWEELHVDLKNWNPKVYEQVGFNWVRDEK